MAINESHFHTPPKSSASSSAGAFEMPALDPILYIVLGSAVLIAIIGFVWFLWTNKQDEPLYPSYEDESELSEET